MVMAQGVLHISFTAEEGEGTYQSGELFVGFNSLDHFCLPIF